MVLWRLNLLVKSTGGDGEGAKKRQALKEGRASRSCTLLLPVFHFGGLTSRSRSFFHIWFPGVVKGVLQPLAGRRVTETTKCVK